MAKELVVVMGLPWSKKSEYAIENFKNYQIISPYYIEKATEYMKLEKNEKTSYLIAEAVTRSCMFSELSIVVIERDAEVESIFIWKKIAVEHDYKIKVLLFDVPLEDCFAKSNERNKESLKHLSEESKKFEQLKQMLNMEHQSMVDKVEVIKPVTEEDKDEVL